MSTESTVILIFSAICLCLAWYNYRIECKTWNFIKHKYNIKNEKEEE